MNHSSAASPSLSYPSSLLSNRLLKASFLPSPKPRIKRPNHLRRKTLTHKPPPLQSPPPPPALPPPDARSMVAVAEEVLFFGLEVEEVGTMEVVEEAAVAAVGADPLAPAADVRSLPGEVLGLALRFAALIAVQTAVAVWFFGGVGGEEGSRSGEPGMDEESGGNKLSEVIELEKKVLEIRAMAEEARKTELRELAQDRGGVKVKVGKKLGSLRKTATKIILDESSFSMSLPLFSKNVNQNLDGDKLDSKKNIGGKLNTRRKVGFLKSIKKDGGVPKGFSGSKSKDERGNGGGDGVKQIAEDAARHYNRGDVRALTSEMTQSLSSYNDFEDSFSKEPERRETNSNSEIGFLKAMRGESSTEVARTNARTANDKSSYNSSIEQIDKGAFGNRDKNNNMDVAITPWWLNLPYVLGIMLRRGSDGNGPKGLYSLEINSLSGKANASSYTIVFQDRRDATNFCYLLESFFEDLGDVCADIVPLTIQELDQAVKSDALKVIVVRKGQIHLYAGQPLVEAESAIRSLLN